MTRRAFLRGAAAATLTGAAGLAVGDVVGRATASLPGVPPLRPGRVREHWLQADSFPHDLAPSHGDAMDGMRFAPDQTRYWAVGYRAYTPGWGSPLPGDTVSGPNTGIPGPVLRGEPGDVIRVHFRNNDTHYGFPHSIHPHGVDYAPTSDGSWMATEPDAAGTAVGVGQTYTYEWRVHADSVGTWPYHDHSVPKSLTGGDPVMELGAELGLFGMIAITDGSTPHADRELCVFFHDLYKDDVPALARDFDCFNGEAFVGNTPTFQARVGERVRWRVAALGKEFHVFHIHGHRWRQGGQDVDSAVVGPSTTLTVDYVEEDPGRWLYHCHVTDHMMGGMVGEYIVDR
jgi:FtsP/CotA-like multicopper oxidase with cupredoxin domain